MLKYRKTKKELKIGFIRIFCTVSSSENPYRSDDECAQSHTGELSYIFPNLSKVWA